MRIAPSRRHCLAALLAATLVAAVTPGGAGAVGEEDRFSRLERKVANLETELTVFEWIGAGGAFIGVFVWVYVFRRQNRTEAEIRDFERNYEDEIISARGAVRETAGKLVRAANRISDERALNEFNNIFKDEWPIAYERLVERLEDLDASPSVAGEDWVKIVHGYIDKITVSTDVILEDRHNSRKVADAVEDIEDAARGMSDDVKSALTRHKASLRRLWRWG